MRNRSQQSPKPAGRRRAERPDRVSIEATIRSNQHLLPCGVGMMTRLFATLLSTSAVCATLTWTMASAQVPKVAVPQGSTTVVVQKAYVKKEVAPASKDGAGPFEAMKKAMVEVMRRKA